MRGSRLSHLLSITSSPGGLHGNHSAQKRQEKVAHTGHAYLPGAGHRPLLGLLTGWAPPARLRLLLQEPVPPGPCLSPRPPSPATLPLPRPRALLLPRDPASPSPPGAPLSTRPPPHRALPVLPAPEPDPQPGCSPPALQRIWGVCKTSPSSAARPQCFADSPVSSWKRPA